MPSDKLSFIMDRRWITTPARFCMGPLYAPVRDLVKRMKKRARPASLRTYRKLFRRTGDPTALAMVITCIKRPIYAEMAIEAINSVHYFENGHAITILCDDICADILESRLKIRLDYPEKVKILRYWKNDSEVPFQLRKIDALEFACRENAAMVDADTIWHASPRLNSDDVVLLVVVNPFSEVPAEKEYLSRYFKTEGALHWNHYNIGFVRIPSGKFDSNIFAEIRRLTQEIRTVPDFEGLSTQQMASLRRVCEEMAISLVCQDHFGFEHVKPLKLIDGIGDRNLMQSLYYGCLNQISD